GERQLRDRIMPAALRRCWLLGWESGPAFPLTIAEWACSPASASEPESEPLRAGAILRSPGEGRVLKHACARLPTDSADPLTSISAKLLGPGADRYLLWGWPRSGTREDFATGLVDSPPALCRVDNRFPCAWAGRQSPAFHPQRIFCL